VLDVVDAGGERPFVECDDAARHVVWGQPRIAEYDGDYRNVDAREYVDRRAKGSANPEEQDQQCHDDKTVGALKRDLDDAGHMYASLGTPDWPGNPAAIGCA
jgi:hypothetical protein